MTFLEKPQMTQKIGIMVSRLLDETVQLYRRHGLILAVLPLLVVLPALLLNLEAPLWQRHGFSLTYDVLMVLLFIVVSTLCQIGLLLQANRCVDDQWIGYAAALRQGFSLFPRFFVAGLLVFVGFATIFMLSTFLLMVLASAVAPLFGFLTFLLVAIGVAILAIRCFLFIPALILDNCSIMDSLARAFQLTAKTRHWVIIVGIYGVVPLLQFVLIVLPYVPLELMMHYASEGSLMLSNPAPPGIDSPLWLICRFLELTLWAVVKPIGAVATVILYRHLMQAESQEVI